MGPRIRADGLEDGSAQMSEVGQPNEYALNLHAPMSVHANEPSSCMVSSLAQHELR